MPFLLEHQLKSVVLEGHHVDVVLKITDHLFRALVAITRVLWAWLLEKAKMVVLRHNLYYKHSKLKSIFQTSRTHQQESYPPEASPWSLARFVLLRFGLCIQCRDKTQWRDLALFNPNLHSYSQNLVGQFAADEVDFSCYHSYLQNLFLKKKTNDRW